MTYESLGQDTENLSIAHGARVGVHDAAADLTKYALVGVVVLGVLSLAGKRLPRKILNRILPK